MWPFPEKVSGSWCRLDILLSFFPHNPGGLEIFGIGALIYLIPFNKSSCISHCSAGPCFIRFLQRSPKFLLKWKGVRVVRKLDNSWQEQEISGGQLVYYLYLVLPEIGFAAAYNRRGRPSKTIKPLRQRWNTSKGRESRSLPFPAEEAWIRFELEASFESYLQMMQKSLWVFIFLKREVEGSRPLRSWKKCQAG